MTGEFVQVFVRCVAFRLKLNWFVVGFALCCLLLQGAWAAAPGGNKGLIDNALDTVTPEQLRARIADYKALGVTWVRYDLDWSVIQPRGPEHYDLRHQDMIISALTEAGINVLGLIVYTPRWANNDAPSKFYPPIDHAAFATFAAHLAARYSARGVHAWEVWNEPNLAAFWSPSADVAAYAALLKATSIAIRKVDPQATILFGGLAQPWDRDGNISVLKFLQGLYDAGARPYFDAAANHPYFSPNFPTNMDGNNWQKMFNTVPSFLSIMARNGDESKALWVTEVGAPTAGADAYGTVIPESAQALMLSQVYTFAADPRYAWLGPVFWYNYRDFPVAPTPEPLSECCFGLRRADGTNKPSHDAYQTAPGSRPR